MTPAQLDELERCLDFVSNSSSLDPEFIHSFNHDSIRTSVLRELLALGRRELAKAAGRRELAAANAPQPAQRGELKVGDRVRVFTTRSFQPPDLLGDIGIVDRIYYEGEPDEYVDVDFKPNSRWAFHPDELEKLP